MRKIIICLSLAFLVFESSFPLSYARTKNTKQQVCNIKGNISYSTKEKIYHMPGWKFYNKTLIDTRYWERWFCSEKEAVKAGWRKDRSY